MRVPENTTPTLERLTACLLLTIVCLIPALAQNTGGVKGKVRNLSGAGIAGATISARQNGVDLKTATADGKGSFVLDGLEPGTYNLAFDAKGYGTAVKYNVEIKSGKTKDLGDRLILMVDRGSRVFIKGSVFFKEGTSAAGALVVIERVNADGSVRKVAETTTDYQGEFGFNQPEGAAKFRLTATYKDGKGVSDLRVDSAMIYRLAIKLDISRQPK